MAILRHTPIDVGHLTSVVSQVGAMQAEPVALDITCTYSTVSVRCPVFGIAHLTSVVADKSFGQG